MQLKKGLPATNLPQKGPAEKSVPVVVCLPSRCQLGVLKESALPAKAPHP